MASPWGAHFRVLRRMTARLVAWRHVYPSANNAGSLKRPCVLDDRLLQSPDGLRADKAPRAKGPRIKHATAERPCPAHSQRISRWAGRYAAIFSCFRARDGAFYSICGCDVVTSSATSHCSGGLFLAHQHAVNSTRDLQLKMRAAELLPLKRWRPAMGGFASLYISIDTPSTFQRYTATFRRCRRLPLGCPRFLLHCAHLIQIDEPAR